ncbi:MAG: hypothetical protein QM674_10280 [Burkholderiaceae bacterium]
MPGARAAVCAGWRCDRAISDHRRAETLQIQTALILVGPLVSTDDARRRPGTQVLDMTMTAITLSSMVAAGCLSMLMLWLADDDE